MNVIEYDIVRAKRSKIAEQYRNMEGNATVLVSERQAKPCGVWKKVDIVGTEGVFFVKTATLYGASQIWKLVADADEVILLKNLWKKEGEYYWDRKTQKYVKYQ